LTNREITLCKYAIGNPCQNRICEENVFFVKLLLKNSSQNKSAAEFGNCFCNIHHPLTLEEIGSLWNMSRERVRQIEENAINNLQFELARKVKQVKEAMDHANLSFEQLFGYAIRIERDIQTKKDKKSVIQQDRRQK